MLMMRGRKTAWSAMTLCGVTLGLALTAGRGVGQGKTAEKKPAPPPGSVTGTITNDKKQPVSSAFTLIRSGVMITAEEQQNTTGRNPDASGRSVLGTGQAAGHRVQSDVNAAGLYTLDKLAPGVYNLTVEAGSNADTRYRPQRLMGVVIHSGKDTPLDITLHEGSGLEEVGEPTVSNSVAMQRGWLEGTLTDANGIPITSAQSLIRDGVMIAIRKGSEALGSVKTDVMAGGFYSVQNCYPGTYSFLIPAGSLPGKKFRPILMSGVVIKSGQRTVLNIVMSEGEGLERRDTSTAKMQPLKLVSP